ncbi:MAG: hypothetical protein H0Z39_11285 [Peptococcaceae bacterium]|nr:hypothetical protein [Peptococcaceae bacterium]
MKGRVLLLRLIRLGLFTLSVYLMNQGQQHVQVLMRETYYNTSFGLALGGLLLLVPVLGVVLLRTDLLYRVVTERENYRMQWGTLAFYGWPFLIVLLLHLIPFISPSALVTQAWIYYLYREFGSHLGVITAMLFGFGSKLGQNVTESLCTLSSSKATFVKET